MQNKRELLNSIIDKYNNVHLEIVELLYSIISNIDNKVINLDADSEFSLSDFNINSYINEVKSIEIIDGVLYLCFNTPKNLNSHMPEFKLNLYSIEDNDKLLLHIINIILNNID